MAKRNFTIDIGKEKILVEGHQPKNVAIKYLMKRRRSLLMTRDKKKVEALYRDRPIRITIAGARLTKTYLIKWERVGTSEFQGSRFTFELEEVNK
ncbi:MAG: hypothetical protein O6762_00165 [Thaumarchaeota archaeon]|nr:hypothetical protein [Nitrososphaerota archaeon]